VRGRFRKKKWSGERTEREVPCLGGWDG
jgi:hypothetical protein